MSGTREFGYAGVKNSIVIWNVLIILSGPALSTLADLYLILSAAEAVTSSREQILKSFPLH
jgi:hypothetical protein